MVRLAGLAGDRGRTLLTLHDRGVDIRAVAVESGNRGAFEDRGIDTIGSADPADIAASVDEHDVDATVIDGWPRPGLADLAERLPNPLRVHPSLLPAFPDEDPIEAALDAGVKTTGVTVTFLTGATGTEPIVTQEPVSVYSDDDDASLSSRVREEAGVRAAARAATWAAEGRITLDGGQVLIEGDGGGFFPDRRVVSDDRKAALRYGENPHQAAAVYADPTEAAANVVRAEQLNEGAKALSYNNYNDADAALDLIKEFDAPAAAVIKHANPAGCAVSDSIADAYDRALATDPMSAFGGIVALNRSCDTATAESIIDSFKEVVVAPGYSEAALDVLGEKENLRVLDVGSLDGPAATLFEKPLVGGRLVQERDDQRLTTDDLEVVTERQPTDDELETMRFAWQTIKHVKSNSIVIATGTETVGIGMGQVSRVDAVHLAAMKGSEHAEGKSVEGAVMASDAFFPFPDGIEQAAEAGIGAVIQPGGSVNDDEIIAAADDLGLSMVFTGQRCFRHD